MTHSRLRRLGILVALALCAGPSFSADPIETVQATAVLPPGNTPGTIPLRILVFGYATDEEIAGYAKTLSSQGPEALLAAISAKGMGRVVPNRMAGADLAILHSTSGADGERRVLGFTGQRLLFAEQWTGPRTVAYPFGVVELELDAKGRGQGALYTAARLETDGSRITAVQGGTKSIRLIHVQVRAQRE